MVTGCSCDGTASSQGVLHVWPWVVRISAPSGSDSNFNVWSCSDEEFDDSAEEQPVSETPTTAATTTESTTRDMTSLLPIFCSVRLSRHAGHTFQPIGDCSTNGAGNRDRAARGPPCGLSPAYASTSSLAA